MTSRVINPWSWQDRFGFVQGLEAGEVRRLVFCAGQASFDEQGAALYPADMRAQFHQALDNLERVLQQAGLTLADVVRLNDDTTDVDAFLAALAATQARLEAAGCRPTSTLLGVVRLASPDLLIEIEATAVA